MNFIYEMPVRLIFGRGCVRRHARELASLGTRALVVTGKSSLKNGALGDVLFALSSNGREYAVYDRVPPNPSLACVRGGLALLKSAGADFVVAIGGGSPMDAAKAIATLALQEREDGEVFAGGYKDIALPMAHVPTTAGTGSEVTPYSVLTNDALETKTSISSRAMFPKLAFLDGSYTDALPQDITVNTALDAFSHAVESLLSRSGTPLSEALARESLRILYPLLPAAAGTPTKDGRDMLLYASALAGMAIAQSGTTAVHGMGYYLTYFYGIAHGRANALLLGETLRLCAQKGLAQEIEHACGADTEAICALLSRLLGERERIPEERLLEFSAQAAKGKNIAKSVYEPTEGEIFTIYSRSLGRS